MQLICKYHYPLFLLLLLIPCLASPSAAATILVPADYPGIQQAIDSANAGDTIVVSGGPYSEEILIDKQLTLSGSGWPVIDGTTLGSFDDVVTITADGVRFEGFDVRNSRGSSGVMVESQNTEIVGNRFSNNAAAGIALMGSSGAPVSGTLVSGNEVTDNPWYGISLRYADNNIITGNNASNNGAEWGDGYGINLLYANANVISENTVTDNNYYGIKIAQSQDNAISKNTIRQCGLGFGGAGIFLNSADNTTVTRNTLNGNDYGVYLGNAGQTTPNVFYLNSFQNSESDHLDKYSSTTSWQSPSEIAYTYHGSPYTGYLGNYWDTYTGSDTDGDGVGEDYFSPGSSNYDDYPLVEGQASYITGSSGPDTTPPGPVTGLGETATGPDFITWEWTDPADADLVRVMIYLDGIFQANVTAGTEAFGATGLSPSTVYEIGTRTVDATDNVNPAWVNDTATTEPEDETPPASVSGLANTTYLPTSITWTWTDPADADFAKVMVYLDSAFQANVTAGVQTYTATSLSPETSYEIGTRTVDASENINPAWANNTATTASAESHPPTASFTFSPESPDTDDTIQFTDTSVDSDGTITGWAWEFGDGGTADVQNSSHQYASAGFYAVNLTVTDDTGVSDTATTTLFVHAAGLMTFTVPGDFGTIQAAIDAAAAGDMIIVTTGTYNEEIEIYKQLTLTGSGWPVIDGTGGITDAVRITSDNVVFEGFEVQNALYAGIYVRLNNNTVVRNNRISSSGGNAGIYVRGSDGAIIFNNTIENNPAGGIWVLDTTGSTIFNNTCTGNADDGFPGILLEDSSGNEVYYNDLDNYCEIGSGFYCNAAESGSTPSTNRWYNETLARGNRYSDYDGIDANGDGIGDTPYDIFVPEGPVINSDPYPLMPTGPVLQPAPTITGIAASGITNESATVGWTIDNGVVSNNRVLYGTDEGLAGAVWSAWDNATTAPSIPLSGLLSNTTYYYRCYAERADDADRNATSTTRSFITLERLSAVITVDDDNGEVPGGSADYATLTDALAAAIDGDTIQVYAGTYTGNHLVDRELTVTGIGMPVLTGLEEDAADEAGDVVAIDADDVVFEGFVVREGYWSTPGYSRPSLSAGIRIGTATYSSGWSFTDADRVTVRNCAIDGATNGIYVNRYSGYAVIDGCTINGTYDGIVIDYAPDATVTDCVLTGAAYYGIIAQRIGTFMDPVSTRITIANTTIADEESAWGIVLDRVSDNILEGNHLSGANTIDVDGDRNRIANNTIDGPCEFHRGGIHIGDGDDNVLEGNFVSHQRYGIWIEPQARRVTMHENEMVDNTYHFGFRNDWAFSPTSPPTHTITTDNTLDGLPLYYFIGEADGVLDFTTLDPEPGYLALVDCRNMTVSDFFLEKNMQGLFLYNVSASRIEGVTAHGNAENGILCFDVADTVIGGAYVDSNGRSDAYRPAGIYLEEATGCTIEDSGVTANVDRGILISYDCNGITIRDTAVTNNGNPTAPGSGIGIYTESLEGLTVSGCTIANTLADLQGEGIHTHADNSLVYNNIFDNTVSNAWSRGTGNRWNVTPAPGVNILGGPWIAGNAWSDYAGEDLDLDGLGDTLIPHTSGGEILYGEGDLHPLLDTAVPDTVPPSLTIVSPEEGGSYSPSFVLLEVVSPDPDVSGWWYRLNGGENVTFVPNATITNLSPGPVTLTVFVSDIAGNENAATVNFTVAEDTTPPSIVILSPEENVTYTGSRDVPLRVWSPDPDVFGWWYALDAGANVTFAPNTTLWGLSDGPHNLTVFADDLTGNVGAGAVHFRVNVTGEAPPETTAGTGDRPDRDPVLPPVPPVQEAAFTIDVLSPEEGRTVDRSVPVRYESSVPLARAWYRLDDGPDIPVTGAGATLDRLVLGSHTLTVTGVDAYGRVGRGSADFEVIPLAIGEQETGGTPGFPDETVYGFVGRPGNYTLSFEGADLGDGEIGVYLNRHLAGVPGEDAVLVSSHEAGGLIGIPEASTAWKRHTLQIPAAFVVPGAENLISFVHAQNPSSETAEETWEIREVIITPALQDSFPSIDIFTDTPALSSGDQLMAWIEIFGIAADDAYTATVYLVDPEGTAIAFPGGGSDPAPLDPSLVAANYYGRSPGALTVTDTMVPGVYRLCADLERTSDGLLVAFASTNVFISADPAVKIYTNREWFGDGMRVMADCAVVSGGAGEDASLAMWLESPDGSAISLPGIDGLQEATAYLHALNRVVDSTWHEGTYILRATLSDGNGDIFASDFAAFEVSRAATDLIVLLGPDTVQSRVVLIDGITLDPVTEKITDGAHIAVSFAVSPGTYWIGGETVAEDGTVRLIPVSTANRVVVVPGDPVTVTAATSAISADWEVIA